MKNNLILFTLLFNLVINFLIENKKLCSNFTFLNIIVTSVLIVFIGSKFLPNNNVDVSNEIDMNMAKMYPLLLSGIILGLYFIITRLDNFKDYILKIIFFISITTSLINILPFNSCITVMLCILWFYLDFNVKDPNSKEGIIMKVYVSNIIAILSALSSINMINVTDVKTGIILLIGLFLFDVFWVFGSKKILNNKAGFENVSKKTKESVMEKVALNVDAPVLLKFFK